MSQDVTPQELMAVFIARDLRDGEVLRVGVAMPVVEAAVRLAHVLHGPNMELIFLGTRMNVAHLHSLPMPAFGWDRRVVRWAESYSDTGHRFDRVKDWHKHVFFIGGVQVDRFGNSNLIGVGPDYRRLRFRGPGPVGTATLTTHVGRYYIVLNSHTPRTLVERCDYVSALGWGAGGRRCAPATRPAGRRPEVLRDAAVRDGFRRGRQAHAPARLASRGLAGRCAGADRIRPHGAGIRSHHPAADAGGIARAAHAG